jgi:hypothetical protein
MPTLPKMSGRAVVKAFGLDPSRTGSCLNS